MVSLGVVVGDGSTISRLSAVPKRAIVSELPKFSCSSRFVTAKLKLNRVKRHIITQILKEGLKLLWL
eukprot:3118561-Ditylum_brightwellii.AAC.1